MGISGIGKGSDGVGSVLSDCTPYRAVIREAVCVKRERPVPRDFLAVHRGLVVNPFHADEHFPQGICFGDESLFL